MYIISVCAAEKIFVCPEIRLSQRMSEAPIDALSVCVCLTCVCQSVLMVIVQESCVFLPECVMTSGIALCACVCVAERCSFVCLGEGGGGVAGGRLCSRPSPFLSDTLFLLTLFLIIIFAFFMHFVCLLSWNGCLLVVKTTVTLKVWASLSRVDIVKSQVILGY